jgi:hypothetical protein
MTPPRYALSVKQPWAWLIVTGLKPVENRTWGMNSPLWRIQMPERIFIHTGKSNDPEEHEAAWEILRDVYHAEAGDYLKLYEQEKVFGAVIGEVDITGCLQGVKSPWSVTGQYQFILKNPGRYPKYIPCQGQTGFFKPDLSEGQRW